MKNVSILSFTVGKRGVNDLKYVNDRFGHDYGDDYLRKACRMICEIYKRSPVFRTGGDEFAVIPEGDDYNQRDELLARLLSQSENNTTTDDGIVIAAGMATREKDEAFNSVFHRADEQMYRHKNGLKEKRPSHILR